jgi:hypothetical protein
MPRAGRSKDGHKSLGPQKQSSQLVPKEGKQVAVKTTKETILRASDPHSFLFIAYPVSTWQKQLRAHQRLLQPSILLRIMKH